MSGREPTAPDLSDHAIRDVVLERDALRIGIAVLAGSPPHEEAMARVTAAALAGTDAELGLALVPGPTGSAIVRASAGAQALMPGTVIDVPQDSAAATAMGGRPAGTRPSADRPGWVEAAVPVIVNGAPGAALVVMGSRISEGAETRLRAFGQLMAVVLTRRLDRTRMSELARTDPLTGLGNRRHFDERFHVAVEQARRHRQPLSLALLDIDHFKEINDQHGHQRGDEVLSEVATRLGATCRLGESMARIGGEEFAWILPLTSGAGAEMAAQRARAAVRSLEFPGLGRITVSIGISELALATDAADLIRRADAALYRAKDGGRDRIVRDQGGA